jgi:DNA-binding CsgD family transcriptional regulator
VVTDSAERARLTGLAGRIEFQSGDLEQAHRLVLDAADAFAALDRRAQAVTMLGVGSLVLHNLARPGDAAALGRRALELVEGESDDVRMRATYHLGRALRIQGRAAEAEPLLEAVVAHLLEPEEPSRLALQRAAIALAVLDRPQEAMPLARRTLEVAHGAGPMQVAYALSLLAQVEMYLGDWRAAVASASEGLALCRDMGQDNVAATFASFLVRIAGARGDGDGLQRWEPLARAAVESSGNRFERLQLDHAAGLLALGDDRPADAVVLLAAVVDESTSLGVLDRDLAAEPDLVEALVRLGRREEAIVVCERWRARGAAEARLWAPPLVARCTGLVAEDDEACETALVQALDEGGAVGDPYATARTRLLLGETLRRRGRRLDARRELAAAVEVFERLDAAAWAERGRRELRASGAKLRRSAEAGDDLTPQELQIALQVAEGKANKEVAATLFLSPKTVEFHLSRIYRKLGVASRAELVRRFATEGA